MVQRRDSTAAGRASSMSHALHGWDIWKGWPHRTPAAFSRPAPKPSDRGQVVEQDSSLSWLASTIMPPGPNSVLRQGTQPCSLRVSTVCRSAILALRVISCLDSSYAQRSRWHSGSRGRDSSMAVPSAAVARQAGGSMVDGLRRPLLASTSPSGSGFQRPASLDEVDAAPDHVACRWLSRSAEGDGCQASVERCRELAGPPVGR